MPKGPRSTCASGSTGLYPEAYPKENGLLGIIFSRVLKQIQVKVFYLGPDFVWSRFFVESWVVLI